LSVAIPAVLTATALGRLKIAKPIGRPLTVVVPAVLVSPGRGLKVAKSVGRSLSVAVTPAVLAVASFRGLEIAKPIGGALIISLRELSIAKSFRGCGALTVPVIPVLTVAEGGLESVLGDGRAGPVRCAGAEPVAGACPLLSKTCTFVERKISHVYNNATSF